MSRAPAQPVQVDGPAGVLQAVIEDPLAADAPAPAYFAVVCHPHPLHGGTMDNKVVTTLARTFHSLGIPTLRFNYRGVGSSVGSWDEGRGETQDALAVLAAGRARWPGAVPWLAGFSFGGFVAFNVSTQSAGADVARLFTIAPALPRHYPDASKVPVPPCPWLVVQGDADEVIDPQQVIQWSQQVPAQPQLVVLPGVGHFFHGKLDLLQEQVLAFARN